MRFQVEDFKEELIRKVKDIQLNDFQSSIDNVRKAIDVMEYLQKQEMLIEVESDEAGLIRAYQEALADKKSETTAKEEESSSVKENDTEVEKNEYHFKKLLTGGTAIGIKDSFISEALVRSYGLESGDLLQIPNPRLPYKFSVVAKKDTDFEDKFVLFRYCVIKKEEGYYYSDEYFEDGEMKKIRIDGVPFKYRYNDYAMSKFNLSEGDVMDLGMNLDGENYIKVIWKHVDNDFSHPKPSSFYKDTATDDEDDEYEALYDYKNKTVLVCCGIEGKKVVYQRAIEECNGQFLYLTGDEPSPTAEAVIKKADVIVLLRDMASHAFVKFAIKTAKEHDIPFDAPTGLGIKNLLIKTNTLVELAVDNDEKLTSTVNY